VRLVAPRIAVPLCLIDSLWTRGLGLLAPVVLILGYWSFVVCIFNLIPARGLDGQIAWGIIPLLRAHLRARRIAQEAIRRSRGDR
jgi:Zn-dependent protease